ncbi:MAG: arylsulfatase [Cyclobacteriaceae bacterium]|nr:arylsulfatase [Cyclobacteriaceae bacterium SS2]
MMRSPFLLLVFIFSLKVFSQERPNVILIITDDQGYGDIGYHGNPVVKTPHLDQLAKESVRLTNFYVSPVCAPTRSSLMTGRYSLRTGVHDTYNGGAIMATEEVTIAEVLKQANYKTGIFGKWHLGDNYPSRPSDQGFDESLIHLAGGMGQPGDFTTYFKFDSSYFDPTLWHNNEMEDYKGYCSDIFAGEALKFIRANKDNPFFCYLAFNAPHTPLQLPQKYYDMYKDVDPEATFKNGDKPMPRMSEQDKEAARKVYGMVTNIDDNVGMILEELKKLKLDKNTIVIFMTDNGPQQYRYTAGFRERKGSVYQGGVRVPFYLRYPQAFKKSKDIRVNAAHIDVLPTLADLCKVDTPAEVELDGQSFLPLMDGSKTAWDEDRSLFFYWTRKYPERYENIAQQIGDKKLVGHTSYGSDIEGFELFDLEKDPYEQNNLVMSNTPLALDLKDELDKKFNELTKSPHLVNQSPIIIGTEFENPVYLNRNDATGERGVWRQTNVFGKWVVSLKEGTYDVEVKFIESVIGKGVLNLETGSVINKQRYDEGETDTLIMENVSLPEIQRGDLIPFFNPDGSGGAIFPLWVKLTKK